MDIKLSRIIKYQEFEKLSNNVIVCQYCFRLLLNFLKIHTYNVYKS